jgi:hypothetical protein
MQAAATGIARARRWVLAMSLLLAVCVAAAALRTAAWPGGAALALALLVPILLPCRACCANGVAPTPGHAVRRTYVITA